MIEFLDEFNITIWVVLCIMQAFHNLYLAHKNEQHRAENLALRKHIVYMANAAKELAEHTSKQNVS